MITTKPTDAKVNEHIMMCDKNVMLRAMLSTKLEL